MLYSDFKGLKISRMGFGTMRLPMLPDSGEIDEKQVFEMTDWAMSHGVNYYDTAYPYCGNRSEIVIGKALSRYPRDRYFLATKYPGHQILRKGDPKYDPRKIFEGQLQKCGVDYFDFYLMHNVNEFCYGIYTDESLGILDYFVQQKKAGRIRHLGFSSHGSLELLENFLDRYGDELEFCQIQLNYLDWTLQQAKEKYEMLTRRGVPVWVMESCRGGRLANLSPDAVQKMNTLRPGDSPASWAYRWLQGLENANVILSGASTLAQMKENVETFTENKPLKETEKQLLEEFAQGLHKWTPCTKCRYCCPGCPKHLDIPDLIASYDDIRFSPRVVLTMRIEAMPEGKKPSACIGCGQCARICPQKIDIPNIMKDFSAMLADLPSWRETCRQREIAAAKVAAESGKEGNGN